MLCESCGNDIKRGWKFCPLCGAQSTKTDTFAGFNEIFESIRKQFMDQSSIERKFDAVENPGNKKVYGFTINIRQNTGNQPRMRVKTFGDVPKESARIIQPVAQPTRAATKGTIIEPKMVIKNLGDRFVVEIELPKADKNTIKIIKLEESLEVKARAKDIIYFKIINLPPNLNIISRSFEKDKLKIEFSA